MSRPAARSAMIRQNCPYCSSVIATSEQASEPTKPCTMEVSTSCRMAFSLIRLKSDVKVGITTLATPTRCHRAQSRASLRVYRAKKKTTNTTEKELKGDRQACGQAGLE